MTVVIVFVLLVSKAPLSIFDGRSKSDENKTVLKDVLGRRDSYGIVRTRRKQCNHYNYVSCVCFVRTKQYEFVPPAVA
jgi:hypothetical protein